jgi:predicted dehydrogenase
VLIEKPMCMTLEEADQLEGRAAASGSIVQVGYMRRYAAAFLEAAAIIVPQRDRIRFARFNDIIGNNSAIVDSTARVVRDAELPVAAREHLRERETAGLLAMHGSAAAPFPNVFSMLLGLGSHDLSAMRELLGMPQGILYAAERSDGRYLSAAFDYGHFVAEFAAGVDNLPRYETYIEIFTDDQVIRVDYDTPYVLNVPARLTIAASAAPAGVAKQVSFPTRQDSFENEWLAFHDSICSEQQPKTSIRDARNDLLIVRDVMRKMA